MSLLDRLAEANRFDPAGLVPFVIDGSVVGHADPAFADALSGCPDVFAISDAELTLTIDVSNRDEASRRVADVLGNLHQQGKVPGWRNELYPVFVEPGEDLLYVERATATLLGIRTIAVNLNGFTEEQGQLSIWLQRRSKTKPISPGKLDVTVSGGLPANGDPFEDLVRECDEEAAIPAPLARRATYESTIDFKARREDGVHHGHYLNYDLELPTDFAPANHDGEVDEFLKLTDEDVLSILTTSTEIAFDSALVLIDFMIRRGVIDEAHPEFEDLQKVLYG